MVLNGSQDLSVREVRCLAAIMCKIMSNCIPCTLDLTIDNRRHGLGNAG